MSSPSEPVASGEKERVRRQFGAHATAYFAVEAAADELLFTLQEAIVIGRKQ